MITDKTLKRTEELERNIHILKSGFAFKDYYSRRAGSVLYAVSDRVPDKEDIDQSLMIIKNNSGLFSAFRMGMNFLMEQSISLYDGNREELFEKTRVVYETMKSLDFTGGEYLASSALIIAKYVEDDDIKRVISNMKKLTDTVRKEQPMMLVSMRYILLTLIAMFCVSPDETSQWYGLVKDGVKKNFGIMTPKIETGLALLLSDDAPEALSKTIEIKRALESSGFKLSGRNSLNVCALLGVTDIDPQKVSADLSEIYDSVDSRDGFSGIFVQRMEKNFYSACLLVKQLYEGKDKDGRFMAITEGFLINEVIMLLQQSRSS